MSRGAKQAARHQHPSDGYGPCCRYLAVDDVRSGEAEVYLVASPDWGEQWAEPVRITDVETAEPRFANPAIAVNYEGVVGVAWYDGRHATDEDCWDLYVSASLDGGATFLPNARVTDKTSCSHVPGNVVEREGGQTFDVARRWTAGGDYFGLVARPDGAFQALWADSRTGVYQLWTTTIAVENPNSEAH